MDQADGRTDGSTQPKAWNRRDLACVLVLAAAALSMRLWQLTHTVVAARDSIGYIRIAWQLEQGDWREVLPKSLQHPLYPLTILAASRPIRHFIPNDLPEAMQLSAQVVSSLASVLLVLPMYLLGKELIGRRQAAFGGTLMFQCLPAGGRLLADGLSEPLFLLLATTSLWAAARGLRTKSTVSFVLAGAASGLAYLTRPEGAALAGAAGLVLLLGQAFAGRRRPWLDFLECELALTAGALAFALPYMLVIGGLTVKPTGKGILETLGSKGAALTPGRAPAGPLFAVWDEPDRKESDRLGWGVQTLVMVVVRGFFWVAWLPALISLWWRRGQLLHTPGSWVVGVLCLVLSLFLYRVAVFAGYLSDRHTVLIILCGCFWAAAGLPIIGRFLAGCVVRLRPSWKETRMADGRVWSAVLLAALCAGPAIHTLQPLHPDRAAYRTAGYWLAEHALPGDHIEDPYAWANYYAGHVFTEGTAAAVHQPGLRYFVFERSDNKHQRLATATEKTLRAKGGWIEGGPWPLSRGKENAEVVVWAVPTAEGEK